MVLRALFSCEMGYRTVLSDVFYIILFHIRATVKTAVVAGLVEHKYLFHRS